MKLNDLTIKEKAILYSMFSRSPEGFICTSLECSKCPFGIIEGECMNTSTSRKRLLNSILNDIVPYLYNEKEADAQ